jgi:hypothetical protein
MTSQKIIKLLATRFEKHYGGIVRGRKSREFIVSEIDGVIYIEVAASDPEVKQSALDEMLTFLLENKIPVKVQGNTNLGSTNGNPIWLYVKK